jgi:hypothetical protein
MCNNEWIGTQNNLTLYKLYFHTHKSGRFEHTVSKYMFIGILHLFTLSGKNRLTVFENKQWSMTTNFCERGNGHFGPIKAANILTS